MTNQYTHHDKLTRMWKTHLHQNLLPSNKVNVKRQRIHKLTFPTKYSESENPFFAAIP